MPEAVHGFPSDRRLNVEKVGTPEGEDEKPTNAIVRPAFGCQTFHQGISRNWKQISIITCMSPDPICFPPQVVRLYAVAPVCAHLEEADLRIMFRPHLAGFPRKEKLSNEEASLP
jgi:hypothetical protein